MVSSTRFRSKQENGQKKHMQQRTCVEERSRCRVGERWAVPRAPPATGVPAAGEGRPRGEDCGVGP